ncbi:hypothetical protein [Bradyrhizobium sp. 150]|uniref:hypothetical protein n=1 Tax=Bradyrhizobium sp. 150 TaxID=2782625 RepID=UPI001FFA9FF0|nr:hypothetical protein [Bradyrhizobium sp. 150]MCK1671076.1 hypothetical protein [Bradyrhizobium sp. 150]
MLQLSERSERGVRADMLAFPLPEKRERDYIAAIGIAAVFVTASGMVRASRDLAASARTLEVVIIDAWWLETREAAELLARTVRRGRPTRGVEARGMVGAEAARLGLQLTPHAVVLARAVVAARNVDRALRAANRRGDLAWFNRAFKARRQGGDRTSFATAWGRLRQAVARRAVLAGQFEYGSELLEDVFSITT